MTATESEETLARLRNLGDGPPVLSVYLPITRGQALHHGFEAEMLNILRAGRALAGNDEAYDLESQRLLDHVRENFQPTGITLALFSSGPRDIFESLSLQVQLPGLARLRGTPYLAPIELALDDQPAVVIAVVDEREARILRTNLGVFETEHRFEDDVPGRQRQGGWAASRYESDRAAHVREHFRHVSAVLQEAHDAQAFKRLVLGGTPGTVAALEQELSTRLRPLLAGSFAAELFADEHELVAAGLAVAETAERREEDELVGQILEQAAAVVGWEPTLRSLGEGRVHRLALAASRLGTPEADRALELAWDSGALVEYVRGAAEARLAAGEGIGALLRY